MIPTNVNPATSVASHTSTDSNSIEQLLKPRYKVIADYPGSVYDVGMILTSDAAIFAQSDYTLSDIEAGKYSHLFEKLEWWEERKPEEMPNYVKWKDGHRGVYEVAEWNFDDFARVEGYLPENENCHAMHLLPATKEEYDQYMLNREQNHKRSVATKD